MRPHCLNYWQTGTEPIQRCTMESEEYLHVAREIISNRPVRKIFIGGEPLLVFEKLIPAIEDFLSQGISLSFNSNACLVSNEIADCIQK